MPIRVLSPSLVNQIAAGEVVERPASVVKELIENSLDAGSKSIRVEAEGGGQRLLAVHDDGAGIPPEELALALASHATSKIGSIEDLIRVSSLGFRGEALASIASVSNLCLISRTRDRDVGALVRSSGGVLSEVRPEARLAGTSVEVRDLFFNTPARRKFLRTDATETAHVVEIVLRLSLARLDVEIELWSSGRRSMRLERDQPLRQRIAGGYGRELAESLLPVEAGIEGMRLKGLLAPPDQARARAQLQHLYVNGRFVRDRTLQGAVRRAYADFLAESLSPVYFLFLEVDPADVDCNVHPTKVEVRLRRSSDVYRMALAGVDRALREGDLTPRVRPLGLPMRADAAAAGAGGDSGFPPLGRASLAEPETRFTGPFERQALLFERPGFQGGRVAPPVTLRPGRYVQVLSTYLVSACEEGLLIMDQHALHERILYRHLREQWKSRGILRQELLHPVRVELSARDRLLVEAAKDTLESVGVRAVEFGGTEIAVSSVPAILGIEDLPSLMKRLVGFLAEERPEGRVDDFADRMLFTMACHRAVRAGDPLSEAQIAALLEEAQRVEHTHTCPHGRPTRVVIAKAELESLFKRRGF